jgi:hypothetical protein
MLAKSPGFTLAAIITPALGIGGNTAIFAVTNALLRRALPYKDPSRLVMLNSIRRGSSDEDGNFSLNRYELIRDGYHWFCRRRGTDDRFLRRRVCTRLRVAR